MAVRVGGGRVGGRWQQARASRREVLSHARTFPEGPSLYSRDCCFGEEEDVWEGLPGRGVVELFLNR